MTLLNGRKARVILEEGYSGDIHINRGTPQGDRSSPYLFIIVIEVLLIKIRAMEGQGINCCAHVLRRIENMDIEKLTAEAYADDLTLIFSMEDDSVRIICDVMGGYERCTGLGLNKGKT
ncbi:MAG: reverse transcriptase domain-containing protein, partial [bacterium]